MHDVLVYYVGTFYSLNDQIMGLLFHLSNNTQNNHKITLFAYEMHYSLANSLQFISSKARKLHNLHIVGWLDLPCAHTFLITAQGTRPKICNYVLINYVFRYDGKLIFSIVLKLPLREPWIQNSKATLHWIHAQLFAHCPHQSIYCTLYKK